MIDSTLVTWQGGAVLMIGATHDKHGKPLRKPNLEKVLCVNRVGAPAPSPSGHLNGAVGSTAGAQAAGHTRSAQVAARDAQSAAKARGTPAKFVMCDKCGEGTAKVR